MLFDRTDGDAGGGQTLAQPFGVIGENDIGRIVFEEGLVMARAQYLSTICLKRPIERIGMRPRQHRERGQPLRTSVRQPPGNAAAPVVTDQMEAMLAIA